MNLYHITKIKNVSNILINGLRRNSGLKGISTYKTERSGVIWLTDNVDYIVKNQIGENYFAEQFAVLSVDVNGMLVGKLTVFPTRSLVTCDHEYFVYNNISPDRIRTLSSVG